MEPNGGASGWRWPSCEVMLRVWHASPPNDQNLVADRHDDHALGIELFGEVLGLAPGVCECREAAFGDGAHGDERRSKPVLVGPRVAQDQCALAERRQDPVCCGHADLQTS